METVDYVELTKNTEICKNCKNIVIGKGNKDSKIMFVGEAPGRKEDEQGVPFVGASGKNLDKLLERIGLTLEDVYIVNILKCRPPENRDPLPEEIKAHTPWLVEQIKQMKPKVVCSLGNYATKFFLSEGNIDDMKNMQGITQVHGKIRLIDFHNLKINLVPLFHPAAIIYNRNLIELWDEDMEIVKSIVNQKTLL